MTRAVALGARRCEHLTVRSSLALAVALSVVACKRPADPTPTESAAEAKASGAQPAPSPSKDPWSKQVEALGGEWKPFDPKLHPDVVVTPVGDRLRLASDLFTIDFAARPEFDAVRDAKGRESLSATLEKPDGAAFAISWFAMAPGTTFDEKVALAEVRSGMLEANEKIISETRTKVAGHDAVTFVTIIDVGRSIHVDTTFIPLPAKRAVLQLMTGYPVGDAAEQKATTTFVASLTIR